jgi:hypothetical protein
MSQSVTAGPYHAYQGQAIIGMKADSMDDNVDTFAAAAPIPVGVVVSRVAAFDMKVQAGGTAMVGIALHDHIIGSRGGYIQYDAVSVLTRGRVWAKVKDATNVEDGVYVHYDPATGEVGTTGTKLVNAVFRSKAVPLPDVNEVVWGDGTSPLGAIVELHYPLADPASTVVGGLGGTEVGPTEETQRYFDNIEQRQRERDERREEEDRRNEEVRRQNAERDTNKPRTRADFEADARRNENQ